MAVLPARVGGSSRPTSRLSPVVLSASAQMRLRRLHREATYREDLHQLVVPLATAERPAEVLRRLLEELFPAPAAEAPEPALADSGSRRPSR